MKESRRHPLSPLPPLAASLAAEGFATFALTLVDGGIAVVNEHVTEPVSHLGKIIAPGVVIPAMIFIFGATSGAHVNPAVTFAFGLRGSFPWRRSLPYIGAQVLGAALAAAFLFACFGNDVSLAMTVPKVSEATAVFFELLMSVFLVTTVLLASREGGLRGPEAAFPVGATLIFCGLFGKAATGASMNPARSLGPALVAGDFNQQWIYLTIPLIGAALASGVSWLIRGAPNQKEIHSAQGGTKYAASRV